MFYQSGFSSGPSGVRQWYNGGYMFYQPPNPATYQPRHVGRSFYDGGSMFYQSDNNRDQPGGKPKNEVVKKSNLSVNQTQMPSMSNNEQVVTLNNGEIMPLLGLGCWKSEEGEIEAAVEAALDCGYRHIDTAYIYLNEEAVGVGINNWLKKTTGKRSDVFVVTKLPMIGMYSGGVEQYLKKSLAKLKLEYIDLYLIHCPIGMKGSNDMDVFPVDESGNYKMDESTDLIAVWKEMEAMADAGLVNSIGVSNFSIRQLRKISANARIQPAVNQVEMHVFFQQREMREFCKSRNIIVTAYAVLGSPGLFADKSDISKNQSYNLLAHPVVALIAERHQVTTAQILIRFLVQQGIAAISKSVYFDKIKINGNVWSFVLSSLEMSALETLDKGHEGRTFDLLSIERFLEHPECPL